MPVIDEFVLYYYAIKKTFKKLNNNDDYNKRCEIIFTNTDETNTNALDYI